ncbi:hypothetical protein PHMEG_00019795 [Phytophthora megakarya]|uniref:Uncharacterized protein n=1 Tax=Phytophthora megakarya TaxID=4795 RepID=A0A225VQE3_9STRA|nr:hypothetical protein PHMEG_00019795 [Phytophthora megakarya]
MVARHRPLHLYPAHNRLLWSCARPAASAGDDTPSPVARTPDLGETIKLIRPGVLPASHASPQGCTNIKPTRAVIPPKRGLDADSFVVGVSVHAAAYRSDTHVQDGYGDVANLLIFDGLSNQDLDDLAQIVGSQSEVCSMVLCPFPGPDDQPLENFEAFLDSLLVRRQMAPVFRQFESERFAEHLFYSISLLHRVLSHHRSSASTRASAGHSVQDTSLRSKYDSLAHDYGFLEAYHEQKCKSLEDTVDDVKSQVDLGLSVADDERAVRETRLTDQVQKLEARLASVMQAISRLAKAKWAKAFDADKLMAFPHENHGSIRGHWNRLRVRYPTPDWVEDLASDDEEIVVSDGDDDAPDQESKSDEKPPASSLPLETSVLDVAPTEKSSSDLRLDTLLTMQAEFGYCFAVKMIDSMDSVRPKKYFRTAEIALKARLLTADYPSEWPKLCNMKDDSLSAHETIEIGESEEEADPADEAYNSKDEAEVQPGNDGDTLSEDETETASERAREKYPGIFSSSDDSSEVMFANRQKYLYFHLRSDLTPTAVKAIDKHIKFMKDNSRAFWGMLHWFVMKTQPEKGEDAGSRNDDNATSCAIYGDRSNRHVGRGFKKRLERIFKRGVPRTIIWEPGFWLYPPKVCYLFLAHRKTPNSSGGKFTLEQQVEAAEREFPARTQWTAYCSDIDRFAHAPKEVRDQLKPEGIRRQNPIHSPAAEVLR